ncbi:TolC family protein [Halobacteriovorax sp. HLS]|uniref:TolC family protein n=1 Tax=Halobacteriovorax sp. HLS TaxID=2234000 RepID=UPI000FDA7B47|nr:TolC family protein [Halobacteriovorax sp. HLS]
MNGFIKKTVLAQSILAISMTSSIAQTTPKQLRTDAYVQSIDQSSQSNTNYKALNLNDVIEQGLRSNQEQEIRKYQGEILDLSWKDSWEEFWIPQVSISLDTNEQRLGTLVNGSSTTNKRSSTPDGTLSLNFGDYTIFNWGKDYLQYLNTKETYKRSKDVLKERSRDLKHDLIQNYFKLYFYQEVERLKRDQLRHASFIYRLNREKISLKKTTKEDYYLSRAEYLRAQNEYHDAKNNVQIQNEQIAKLINDEVGTKYLLRDSLKYKLISTSLSEAIKLAKKTNPSSLNAQVGVENAKRSYELALKENLPLPKISLKLGAYDYRFNSSTNSTHYSTGPGNSDIDIVASINATWSITGKGGLFNDRATRSSMLEKHIAFSRKGLVNREVEADIKARYFTVTSLQNQINILDARIPTLQKTFDTILENYMNKKTRYINFKNTLIELTETQILMEQTKYIHLVNKIELARTIGLEDFPGENFENLAVKIKE